MKNFIKTLHKNVFICTVNHVAPLNQILNPLEEIFLPEQTVTFFIAERLQVISAGTGLTVRCSMPDQCNFESFSNNNCTLCCRVI